LRIRVGDSEARGDALLDPAAADWQRAAPTAVLLSRTPRIYQTEPMQDRSIPGCQVRARRASGKLYVRLQWDDATRNAPAAPPARTGEGGDPKQLYKRPTGETASFADAAAVMIPEQWTGPAFPSLLMGDKHTPARLYYWSASRGTQMLSASGRATPQPTGVSFPHCARHAEGQWTVTMEIPDPADGYPVAFAIWDGEFGDRDGVKFFSIWYVLTRSP
jgi:complex iron-sulfur molybdoenzyme family reductase subunit gamma